MLSEKFTPMTSKSINFVQEKYCLNENLMIFATPHQMLIASINLQLILGVHNAILVYLFVMFKEAILFLRRLLQQIAFDPTKKDNSINQIQGLWC